MIVNKNSVAVVVPAYNCEALIEETLIAIAEQSTTADEVWIVNDGSADGTAAVVSRFIERREGWHLLSKANGGVSSARNTGVEASGCEWIAFVDSDDLWSSDHLTCLMQNAKESGAEIIVSGVEVFEERVDNIIGSFYLEKSEIDGFPKNLFFRNNIVPSAVLMKRNLFRQLGGFDEQLTIGEDWDLWLLAFSQGIKFHFTEKSTVLYRRHAANATSNMDKTLLGIIQCLEKNLMRKQMFPNEIKKQVSLCYRRLGNAAASNNRKKSGQYFRAAIASRPNHPLNYIAYLIHTLHAMALYRWASRLWLSLRLAMQKK